MSLCTKCKLQDKIIIRLEQVKFKQVNELRTMKNMYSERRCNHEKH